MKKLLFILIPTLFFIGCSDPLSSQGNGSEEEFPKLPETTTDMDTGDDTAGEPQTKGRVIIELVPEGEGVSLLLREPEFIRYVLTFTHESGESLPAVDLDGEKQEYSAELENGNWTVSAIGFIAGDAGGDPIPAALGSTELTVEAEKIRFALITLVRMSRGGEEGESGAFSFAVRFPGNRVRTALLTLSRPGDEEQNGYMEIIDLGKIQESDKSEGVLELPSGAYRVELFVNSLYPPQICAGDLHIYPNKKTEEFGVNYEETDFPAAVELSGAAALRDYLDSSPQNSRNDPYRIRLSGIDLSSADTSGDTLRTLYDSLTRFAALDLSGCTGENIPGITLSAAPNKEHLVALILPESVTKLSRESFKGCANLITAELPGITFIGRGAFSDCAALEWIFLPRLETLEDGDNTAQGVFYRCTALIQAWLPEAHFIGAYSFYNCTALEGISLPAAETLGAYALKGCSSLVSVNIPRAHTAGSQTFHSCGSLVSLTLPALRTIGSQGFYSCHKLTGISLPVVTSIGSQSFYGCSEIKSLTLGEEPPVLDGGVIFSKGKPSEAIYVPAGALETYMATDLEGWTDTLKKKIKPLVTL
jgi:hypothetical protein